MCFQNISACTYWISSITEVGSDVRVSGQSDLDLVGCSWEDLLPSSSAVQDVSMCLVCTHSSSGESSIATIERHLGHMSRVAIEYKSCNSSASR